MIRGLYTSGWSMQAHTKKMDVIANNLANVDTNGYKKDTFVFEAFPELNTKRVDDPTLKSRIENPYFNGNPYPTIGSMSLGADVAEVNTYFENIGPLQETGRSLDFALGESNLAYFVISNNNGEQYLTRDGAFFVNQDGVLMTKDGNRVLGTDGNEIVIPDAREIVADYQGNIMDIDGNVVGSLMIRQYQDTTGLKKLGNNLVEAGDGAVEVAFDGSLQQGYLEKSNVQTVREMVDMIAVMRAYEANSKILQIQDETLGKAVNELASR